MAIKPHVIFPDNRLADMVDVESGDNARGLVEAAGRRVVAMRPALESYVETRLNHLMRFVGAPDESLFAESRILGAAALEIAEVAGAAEMMAIGEIARGISAMVESLRTNGVWHTDALRVHLQAMSLAAGQMRATDPWDEAVMLDRLRAMRGVLGVSE